MLSQKTKASRLRSQRLSEARKKGRHTAEEWQELQEVFAGMYVRCWGVSGNIHIQKDHIIPLYMGGSDSIRNIQPLCAWCNASKGPETLDWRWYRWRTQQIKYPLKFRMRKEDRYGL